MHIPGSKAPLEAALEGLAAVDAQLLRQDRYPRLYESGVRYRCQDPGSKRWLTIPEVLQAGRGACKDLAAWRAAELRVLDGEPAKLRTYRTSPRSWHAVVERGDGSIEDPSRLLGMKECR